MASDPNQQTPTPIAALWTAAAACAANDVREEGGELRDRVGEAVASIANAGRDLNVYVTKTNASGYRNQVWQGQGNTQPNDVMVLVDVSGNLDGVSAEARARLNPTAKNGFDAVVICEEKGKSADWSVRGVVEYEHSSVAASLSQELGQSLEVRRIADPAMQGSTPVAFTEPTTATPQAYLTPAAICQHLLEAKNVIMAGPPGTGKTRLAQEAAGLLAGASDIELLRLESVLAGRAPENVSVDELQKPALVWDIVQLHPSYGYEEFVRGVRTDPEVKGFSLRSVDGILLTMARVAARRGTLPTLLIVDEINRANIPAVFGETIFAIDPAHRGRPVRLQYEGAHPGDDTLVIPPNLLVLGTMNTADRSIAMVDFAVRRRFRFLNIPPSDDALSSFYSGQERRGELARALMAATNSLIADADIRVGHSYFMVDPSVASPEWVQSLADRLLYEVRPLLREYYEEGRMIGGATIEVSSRLIDLLEDPPSALLDSLHAFISESPAQ